MNDKNMFTNEQLTAYLDDEADAELTKKIDTARLKDADINKCLDGLTLNRKNLVFAFDSLLGSAPAYAETTKNMSTLAPALRHQRTINGLSYAAAALLFCAVGWASAGYFRADSSNTWQRQAAIYHSLYVSSTLNQVQNDAATMQAELSRVSLALGKNISLQDLSQVSELELKRAQTLGFKGRPLIQVAYLSRLGTPIVLCIMKSGEKPDTSVKTQTLQGMSAAEWSKGEYEFLLIGGTDRDMIERAANAFSKTL